MKKHISWPRMDPYSRVPEEASTGNWLQRNKSLIWCGLPVLTKGSPPSPSKAFQSILSKISEHTNHRQIRSLPSIQTEEEWEPKVESALAY